MNPSFEDTIPFGGIGTEFTLSSYIKSWYAVQLSPDYFSTSYSISQWYSDTSGPYYSNVGAMDGSGNVGEFLYSYDLDVHEYFGGSLSSPLQPGRKYCFEFYFKRATFKFHMVDYASDGLGAYFTKDSIRMPPSAYEPLPFVPQVRNPYGNVLFDTVWVPFTGEFIAQGGEKYFIVGNFRSGEETVVSPPPTIGSETYYFFDDFSVWYCDSTTITEIEIDPGLPHQHPVLPLIIPNLLSAYGNSTWQIGNLPPKTEVMLYNALGQLVFRSENYANELTAAQLAAGMYFYEITPPQREMQKGKLVVVR
ncbi:MAG: gliding motility-associated C-terminal domain-containing protein [Bacteroidetes bacterium]|nr:gliding motility-associated C-terminal domain-containing protein [Bacteroidota bacterium]